MRLVHLLFHPRPLLLLPWHPSRQQQVFLQAWRERARFALAHLAHLARPAPRLASSNPLPATPPGVNRANQG